MPEAIVAKRAYSRSEQKIDKEKEVKRIGKAKHYHLTMPQSLYDKLEEIANERDVSVVDLIRTFIKLGLVVMETEKDESSTLIIRKDGVEREVVLPI